MASDAVGPEESVHLSIVAPMYKTVEFLDELVELVDQYASQITDN